MSAVIDFIKKYKHAFVILIYLPVYLLWFFWLEAHVTADYHIIESSLDAYIPFCEYFIVPYLLWFPFGHRVDRIKKKVIPVMRIPQRR